MTDYMLLLEKELVSFAELDIDLDLKTKIIEKYHGDLAYFHNYQGPDPNLVAAEIYYAAHSVLINGRYYNHNKDQLRWCTCCGRPDTSRYVAPVQEQLDKYQVCHTCNYWDREVDFSKLLIAYHSTYSDGGKRPEHERFLGHAGRWFHIQKADGTLFRTNNLWHGGQIPHRLWQQQPDNAKFLTKEDYLKLGGVL